MSIEVIELKNLQVDTVNTEVMILPYNYGDDEGLMYDSTAISFYKYSKDKLDIRYYSNPEILVEQRSNEWFTPLLFVSSAAMSLTPELTSILCGLIANYVTDFFKGQSTPDVRINVIYKETKNSKLTKISYEGDLEGLDKLKDSIDKVFNQGRVDD